MKLETGEEFAVKLYKRVYKSDTSNAHYNADLIVRRRLLNSEDSGLATRFQIRQTKNYTGKNLEDLAKKIGRILTPESEIFTVPNVSTHYLYDGTIVVPVDLHEIVSFEKACFNSRKDTDGIRVVPDLVQVK